jgi:hypothetical protein
MNEEPPHGNTGNQNAAKPKREKLSATRTFRFRDAELKAYIRASKAAPKINGETIPLRLWVRSVLNAAAGMPPPIDDE